MGANYRRKNILDEFSDKKEKSPSKSDELAKAGDYNPAPEAAERE